MSTFRLILYPYAGAIAGMAISMFAGMAAFGSDVGKWQLWQSQVISTCGTIVGVAGALVGVYIALRSEGKRT